MMTAIIVDDEEDSRSTLRNYLNRYCPDVTLLAEAGTVAGAVRHIRALNPDIVFLDMNMPHENGLALFASIPHPDFYTIFVTAHNEYALSAIKHNALDYLMKPVNITELVLAVNRAKAMYDKDTMHRQLDQLLQSVQKRNTMEKICLPLTDGFIYVYVHEIIRCEAEGSYSVFYFTNRKKLVISRTLGNYENLLREYGFIRVHNSHLINLEHVEKYQRGRGGMVLMSDKKEVIVSQRKRDDFLRLVNARGMGGYE